MGTDDDARVILAAMFDRIVRGPHVALDVDADAPPAEVRAAFHTLAKQYHPARFGRMSPDTQRLANEVFLGLRMAHDNLMKASAGRQSTAVGVGIPTRGRPNSTQPPPQAGRPADRASGSGAQPLQPLRSAQPPPPTHRHQTGPVPIQRPPAATTPNHAAPQRPAPATGTGPRQLPPQRPPGPATSPVSRPAPAGQAPPARQTSQAIPTSTPTRPTSHAVPLSRTQTEPRVSPPAASPDGIRIAGARPANTNPRLTSAIELLARQQWDAARAALTSLAAESPASSQIKALLAYETGRRAQMEKRLDEARVELQRALQLDPDLTLAKTALGELFARRK